MKKCKDCKIEKPIKDFHKMTKAPDGLQYRCKQCVKEIEKGRKEYHKNKMKKLRANPEYKIKEAANKRDYRLQWSYGITEKDYYDILESQNHSCYICNTHERELPRSLCVDHNHKTGTIRGLLCDSCNRCLGLAKDSSNLLRKMAKYLDEKGSYGS